MGHPRILYRWECSYTSSSSTSSSPFFNPVRLIRTPKTTYFFMTLFLLMVPLFTFVIFLSSAAYYKLLDSQAMMSFYKKLAPHSLLGLTAAAPPPSTADENLHHYIPSLTGGLLGLVTDVTQRHPALVLESSTMKHSSSSLSLPPFLPPPAIKRVVPGGAGDIGGLRFLDGVGGGVDGFVSCTESLGFESSDEIMRVDDQNEEVGHEVRLIRQQAENNKRAQWRKTGADKRTSMDKEGKKFPPPISSLNQNGQPSFYLRPVRKDGRLELTEVRLHRPETLRAYRGDGRLRLHLISHDEEDEEECVDHDLIEEEEIVVVEEERVDVREEIEKVEVEASVNCEDQWTMGVVGGEGFRRCQDNVHHHHHHHHVWHNQQHCVV